MSGITEFAVADIFDYIFKVLPKIKSDFFAYYVDKNSSPFSLIELDAAA